MKVRAVTESVTSSLSPGSSQSSLVESRSSTMNAQFMDIRNARNHWNKFLMILICVFSEDAALITLVFLPALVSARCCFPTNFLNVH